jgi:hypothetical protein
MQFTLSLVLGIVLGVLLLGLTRPKKVSDDAPAAQPRWAFALAMGMGILAALVFGAAWGTGGNVSGAVAVQIHFPIALPITLPAAAVMLCLGNLVRSRRDDNSPRWMTWVGLILSGLPALFWVAFVIGELTGPPH